MPAFMEQQQRVEFRLQPDHVQSANNTPRRRRTNPDLDPDDDSSVGPSFGYATLASPYSMEKLRQQHQTYLRTHFGVEPKNNQTNSSFIDVTAEGQMKQQLEQQRVAQMEMYRHSIHGGDFVDNEDSISSLNRSENTVINIETEVKQTPRSPPPPPNFEPDLGSSEDNLSHESYELIEKDDDLMEDNAKKVTPANKFEQEFYRQAQKSTISSTNGSSRPSSTEQPPPLQQQQQQQQPQPIMKQNIRRKSSSSSVHSSSQKGHFDVVRVHSHTLPRNQPQNIGSGPEFGHVHEMVQSGRYYVGAPGAVFPHPHQHVHVISRTLPNRGRRENYSQNIISSPSSSSSHASPQINRPKSLEFAVIQASNLPQKTAYGYQDDTLEVRHQHHHRHHPQPQLPDVREQQQQQQHHVDYDDSSSAISAMNELNYASSSDVPQTPEMPTMPQFPPPEERIYDVPETVEGQVDAYEIIKSPSKMYHDLPQVEIDPRKFESFMQKAALEQQRFYGRPPIPPPRQHQQHQQQHHLLPTMSSTESESALSARSAPTPVGGANNLSMHQQQQQHKVTLNKELKVGLISPPEESESTAMEGEVAPAPPPEFSGADVIKSKGVDDVDTDVEIEDIKKSEVIIKIDREDNKDEHEVEIIGGEEEEEEEVFHEERVSENDDVFVHEEETEKEHHPKEQQQEQTPKKMISSPPTVLGEEEESSTDPNLVKMGEMYVRLGSGSTTTSNGNGTTLPYADESEEQTAAPSLSHFDSQDKTDDDGDNNGIPLPPSPLKAPPLAHISSESSEGSLDIASIPPPAAVVDDDNEQEGVKNEAAAVVQHSHSRPSSNATTKPAFPTDGGFPFVGHARTLSRISENSSSGEKKEDFAEEDEDHDDDDDDDGDDDDEETEPNLTTSEDEDNQPSLTLDKPKIAPKPRILASQIVRECGMEPGAEIEFPSPPSEMNQNTEVTQLDSSEMFLSPPDDDKGDHNEDKIPYDLSSISSANDVTREKSESNKQDKVKGQQDHEKEQDGAGGGTDSDGSLHDSMEILEEVATEDRFEREIDEEEADERDETGSDEGDEDVFDSSSKEIKSEGQSEVEANEPHIEAASVLTRTATISTCSTTESTSEPSEPSQRRVGEESLQQQKQQQQQQPPQEQQQQQEENVAEESEQPRRRVIIEKIVTEEVIL